ncbi:MAG TPA: aldehyde dehydrogenase family protein [Marmoricola sp.]|nr:aldehyde dehydrogenase family protein [Marmoricola sp.]
MDAAESSFSSLDDALRGLVACRDAWVEEDLDARMLLLDRTISDTYAVAADWVEVECERKGIPVDSPTAGEEWFAGPLIVVRHLRLLRDTLQAVARQGRPDLPGPLHVLADGTTVAPVFPTDTYDRLLFLGITGEARMLPGVGVEEVQATVGGTYRSPGPRTGGVAAVLGAGNISAIPACDVLAKLFVEDQVVALKLSPLTRTLAPVLEAALRPLVEGGYLRILQGGAPEAVHLVAHDLVDAVHMTGSASTHDALVFGTGASGARRKAAGTPHLTKPMTAELGNVTPLVVVPGPWSRTDLRYQAEHIATGLANNAGFNCVSTRMMLTQRGWGQREDLLAALRSVLRQLPNRCAYYPHARHTFMALVEEHPQAELLGGGPPGSLPWGLLEGLDPVAASGMCEVEAFAPMLTEVAFDAASPADFLDRAVSFCNERMWGTLGITLLVHPASLADPATSRALDRAVAELRYGTVAVNIWAASAFGLVSPPWGAFPSEDLTDTQSGRGFVHNTYLLPHLQKTVMRAPFRSHPKPPWFVTHERSRQALAAATHLNADPDPRILPGLLAAALRG